MRTGVFKRISLNCMHPTPRIDGFRGEFLWELEIAERQMMAMVEAIPAEKYDWRPDQEARSISEAFVHVAVGNFMLLEALGATAPDDLYGEVPGQGQERLWGLIRRNDELEKSVREKDAVTDVLKRSLQAVRSSITQADDAEPDRELSVGVRSSETIALRHPIMPVGDGFSCRVVVGINSRQL